MKKTNNPLLGCVTLLLAAQPVYAAADAAGVFFDPGWKTSNASVAVDAEGGLHLAFYYYEPVIEDRPTHAVYAYCAGQCDNDAAWHSVGFGTRLREVQLKLTPAGNPRLLLSADSTVYTGGKDHYYGACDSDCARADSWQFTRIASSRVPATGLENDDELPQRAFALDPQGRPRFVYYDENQAVTPNHFGLFYLACDARCEDRQQWRETLISAVTWEPRFSIERVYHPALAFTPDGRPRIASAEFFPADGGEPSLTYFACDDACENSAGWQKVALLARGGGTEPSADIAVDSRGRPRIAFYQEALLNGQGKRLFYLWCNGDCLQAAGWQRAELGLGFANGQEPDLEIDRQDRPRIAYADWERGGIGIAWCDERCESAEALWQQRLLEDRTDLYAAWPVAYPPHCDGGLWNSLTPTLALPASGLAKIAFDATYHAHCLYDDDPTDNEPPVSRLHLIMRAARLISLTLPSASEAAVFGDDFEGS